MSTTIRPESVIRRFAELLAAGDVDRLVDLYEPDAAFSPEPGTCVTGHEQIRRALEPFAAVRPVMEARIEKVIRAGETALVCNRWSMRGTGLDGNAIELHGTSADVLRRRTDGSWGIVIDDPWGTGAHA